MNLKSPLFICSTLLAFSSQAQISINRSDFGQIGDQVLYAYDTTLSSNFSEGASGEDKTWDFNTGNVSGNYYDYSVFADPRATEGTPEEANLMVYNMGGAEFYDANDNDIRIVIPMSGLNIASPVVKIATFPMNYLTSVNDSAASQFSGTPDQFGLTGLPFDSIRVSIDIHTQSLADGWGLLKIDNDSFQTLRVKNETQYSIDIEGVLVFMGVPIATPLQSINESQTIYAWYGNNKKFALAQAELDSNGNVAMFQYQVKEMPTVGLEHISKTISSSIQPNPASEELHINFTSNYAEKGTLVVVDITGKIILSQAINIVKDQNDVVVKTAELNNGIYFTRIVSEHVNTSSKFVVRH